MILASETEVLGEKPAQVPLCPPQIWHKQAWNWAPRPLWWEASDYHLTAYLPMEWWLLLLYTVYSIIQKDYYLIT